MTARANRRWPRPGPIRLAALAACIAVPVVPALGAGAVAAPAPAPRLAAVEQPRAFGHTVGDVLAQRVALGTAAAPFSLADIPRVGRVGSSLWRRRSEVRVDAAGRHWLELEYQLINTPQQLSVWYLPKLTLKPTSGGGLLAVAPRPFTIGPFTPPQPFEEAALPALQPDQPPTPVALAPIERRIRNAGAALGLVLLAWAAIAGWRQLRRGRHLPFARAVRDLRSMPGADPLAVQRRVHHALNDSAGEVVRPGSLARLLARAPHFVAERAALEAFLQESHAVFFGGRPAPDAAPIAALARRLRRLEQRHAR